MLRLNVLWVLLLSMHVSAEIKVVPTYNSLGIYWSGVGGNSITCNVEFREQGTSEWFPAHELWWDNRPSDQWHGQEYRGSIVGLKAGTTYEIKLTLSSGESEVVSAATFTEVEFLPISKTIKVSSGASGYEITEGGSENGYVLYDGRGSTLTGSDESGVTIKANYVILRGLTIENVGSHGVVIEKGHHHIVIEDLDVTKWGKSCTGSSGTWQKEMNNAIHSTGCVHNITIQNNKLHHPNFDANNWKEKICDGSSSHPAGARGVGFYCGEQGAMHQLVIRHNEIYSDMDHMFNDGMGNNKNFSYSGFPGMDTDIHGNKVSHCWDDGLELEGANGNVRVYENDINQVNIAMAFATTSVGPLYAFRNISREQKVSPSYAYGWSLFKLGAEAGYKGDIYSKGKIYLYHNQSSGLASTGIAPSTDKKRQWNVTSRNNLLHTYDGGAGNNSGIASHAKKSLPDSDLDYDMYNGKIPDGMESNGIHADPIYNGDVLAENSPGYDAGVIIPNFNDKYSAWPYGGAGPEIGAFEDGSVVQIPTYKLTVKNGYGSGNHAEGKEVNVVAKPLNRSYSFKGWSGDVQYLENAGDEETNLTMPANEVAVEATFTPIPEYDFVRNGAFSEDDDYWELNKSAAEASVSIEGNKAVISITNASSQIWDPQLLQDEIPLENSFEYTLKFEASAQENRSIEVVVGSGPPDYISYKTIPVELTNETVSFSFDFESNIHDDNARIDFNLGQSNSGVSLGNVSFVKHVSGILSSSSEILASSSSELQSSSEVLISSSSVQDILSSETVSSVQDITSSSLEEEPVLSSSVWSSSSFTMESSSSGEDDLSNIKMVVRHSTERCAKLKCNFEIYNINGEWIQSGVLYEGQTYSELFHLQHNHFMPVFLIEK